jgi:hypothetical protein
MNLKPLKDADLEAYYQALFAMYGTPGWKALMEDVSVMREDLDTARGLDAETLRYRQGELEQIDWLYTHQARSEAAYASIVDEQEGESEAPTGGTAKVIAPEPK